MGSRGGAVLCGTILVKQPNVRWGFRRDESLIAVRSCDADRVGQRLLVQEVLLEVMWRNGCYSAPTGQKH
jgi:hypothetical protein